MRTFGAGAYRVARSLKCVYWAKAHLDADVAIGRAGAGGYPEWHYQYNDGAGALAEPGAEIHTEDCETWAMRQRQLRRNHQHIKYFLDQRSIARHPLTVFTC